jgi:hypothetical protein
MVPCTTRFREPWRKIHPFIRCASGGISTHHVVPKEFILIIRLVCRIQLPPHVGSRIGK